MPSVILILGRRWIAGSCGTPFGPLVNESGRGRVVSGARVRTGLSYGGASSNPALSYCGGSCAGIGTSLMSVLMANGCPKLVARLRVPEPVSESAIECWRERGLVDVGRKLRESNSLPLSSAAELSSES